MVRRSVVHNSVPVPSLSHFEATAIQVTLHGKLVKTLLAYVAPLRPLFGAYPTTCFGRWITGLDGFRLQRETRGLELAAEQETGGNTIDYAEKNSCLMFIPNPPITNPHNPSATPIYIGHRDNKETLYPGLSDFVLCSKLEPPRGSH